MSRRPKSNASPISLFTFLDTLMCTMGALILLLIALSIKMRPKAGLEELLAPAPAAVQPAVEPLPVELPPARPAYTIEDRERDLADQAARRRQREAEWSAALAAAQAERDLQQQQHREHSQTLARARRKLREAQDRARQAGSQTQAVEQAQAAARAAQEKLNSLEEQIAQQIAATRRNLEIEQRKQATKSNEYALVPYDGTSGTMRRPIYIECTNRGYRFIPENVAVAGDDLQGFRESFNPLLSGTQALLRYWNYRRRESGGDEPEPYVLLIVRPSGSLAYYEARSLLTPIGAHFGYELVEEDWKLALPDPDPQAVAAVRDAIEITVDARQRVRETLAAAGRGHGAAYGSNRRPQSLDPFSEEYDDEPRRPRSDDGETGSGFRKLPGDDHRAGGQGAGNGDSRSVAGGTGRPGAQEAGGTPGAAAGGQAAGMRNNGGARNAGPGAVEPGSAGGFSGGQLADQHAAGAPGAAGQSAAGVGQSTNGGTGGGERRGQTAGGAGAKPRVLAANMSGRPGSQGPGQEGLGAGFPAGDLGEESAVGSGNDQLGGSAGDGSSAPRRGDPSAGKQGSASGGSAGSNPTGRGARRGGARPASISGASPTDLTDESGRSQERDSDALRRPSDDRGATDAPGGDGDEPGLIPLPDTVAAPYGHLPRPNGLNQERAPGRLRELEPDRNERKPRSDSPEEDQPRQFGPSSGDRPWLKDDDAPNASDKRGGGSRFGGPSSGGGGSGDSVPPGGKRRWGKSNARAGIGLERKVTIAAKADHLLIGPDVAVGVAPNEKPEALLQKIMSGLEQTAQNWGEPPANFYWMPSVRFIVYPGGNAYYERVRGLLQKNGVASTVYYHREPAEAEKLPAAAKTGGPRR